jgi:hypothetical protein
MNGKKIEEDFGNRWLSSPYVQFGDIVEEEIVNYFASVDEPVTMDNELVQCGKCFVNETKRRYEDIFADDMERLFNWDITRLEAFVHF